jgi:hypothetical protein
LEPDRLLSLCIRLLRRKRHKKIHASGVVQALLASALAAGDLIFILKNEIVHIIQNGRRQSTSLLSLISPVSILPFFSKCKLSAPLFAQI